MMMMRGRRSVVWVTGVVVIDNMIHNLSIDSHNIVSDLNAAAEMEEERGTHDMCAVCLLSSLSYRHCHHYLDHDRLLIMKKEEEEVTNMIAALISGGDLFIDMKIAD